MNENKRERKFLKGFKSIQSTIFVAVSALVLCAVLAATAVSVRYTNSTVYENSAIYTQTIIHQLNQNVDSYITYMDNIASVIAKSQDAYQLLYQRIGEDEAVKEALTIEEAAKYFRIGENKLRKLAEENPNANWVILNGNRIQIKRKQFEKMIDTVDTI